MDDKEIEAWLDSYSDLWVDRRGKPIKNRDIPKMFNDMEYRTVARDKFEVNGEDIHVSTVFLGMPHLQGLGSNKQVLYETMIFGGKHNDFQRRWENAAIATQAHAKIVKALKEGDDLPFEDTNIWTQFFGKKEAEEGEESE